MVKCIGRWSLAAGLLLLAACGDSVIADPLVVTPVAAAGRSASASPVKNPRPKASAKPTGAKSAAKAGKPVASPTAKPATGDAEKAVAAPSAKPAVAPKASAAPAVVYKQAASFQLTDQHGKVHAIRFPPEKVTVLAFGDREGSGQLEGWIKPLYTRYTDRIVIEGVADLSAVPGFARGMVQGVMNALTANPVMLDWEGKVTKAYDYEAGQANLVTVDREGRIVHRTRGAASETALAPVFEQIDRLIEL